LIEVSDVLLKPLISLFAILENNVNFGAPLGILLLGLVTGLRHSMEADHLAAVSTMVASGTGSLKRASILGALWGVGHTSALFIAGLLVLLLAVNIPPEFSARLEFGVGIMLVFLATTTITGLDLAKLFRGMRGAKGTHSHVHSHSNFVHAHNHTHDGDHHHTHKSLVIGIIHGMAGSGALMLVVLSTIQSIPLGLAYIAIFGAGSMASMAGISTLMGIPFAKVGNSLRLRFVLRYAAGFMTLAVGIGLIYNLVAIERIFN
jgi:hypothetical protein